MEKKIRLIKQVVNIFLLLLVNSSIFSETITKRIGRNFFTLESFRNYYYLCCLDNEKIKIQEKIYKDEEEPEIFWK